MYYTEKSCIKFLHLENEKIISKRNEMHFKAKN